MVDILFPMKGWDTNHPRFDQPQGTSASLLNVVPFDRDFRGRGSIRSGLSKFSPSQLGGGNPVFLVSAVTTALDPSSVVANQQLLNETFNYANGELNTVAPTNWLVTDPGGTTQTGYTVTGGNSAVATASNRVARYKPVLTFGAAYVVKVTITMPASPPSGFNAGIAFQMASTAAGGPGAGGANVYCLTLGRSGGTSWKLLLSTGATPTSVLVNLDVTSLITIGTPVVLELHVNGTKAAGYLNGTLKIAPTTISASSGSTVGMTQDSVGSYGVIYQNFQVFTANPLAAFRQTNLVAVSNGSIYTGTAGRGGALAVATSGTAVLASSIKPQMASRASKCYFVDSQSNMQVLDLPTQTVSTMTVSAGTETAATLGANTLACVWRDRLVVAAPPATPQNFFMSRQGNPNDWDYSQLDAAAAVAGNASKAGAIGEPLNCLMPWTDDVLMLGGDHSIYKVEGDIAAGGSILLVTDTVGTLGPDCWDTDPNGNVYFAGSGGLYRVQPNGLPENIANQTVRNFFASINRSSQYVCLTWDRDRNGLYIFVTPAIPGAATHLFWDATTGGFFPIAYPTSFGPVTAVNYDGDGPLDRQVLLACRDGYVRMVDPTQLDDDGTAITSSVFIGPFRPAGDAALSVLEAVEVMLGDAPSGFTEANFQMNLNVIVAKDVYSALNAPLKTVSFTFTKQARRKRLLQRISGGTFFFQITGVAEMLWSLEKLVALFTEGGLQRRY